MSLVSRLSRPGPSGFGYGSTALDVVAGLDLAGRTVLITGCNSGIGQETLRAVRSAGAQVVGLARTAQKARDAGADHPIPCDLGEPSSIRSAIGSVRALPTLDAIVANAGIMALPKLELAYGWERQWFTNHVGHAMLVDGLIDRLAPDGRVVVLSSTAHRRAPPEGVPFDRLGGAGRYDPWEAYGISKLCNLLYARELATRLDGGRTAVAVHPGVIRTRLDRHLPVWQRAALAALGPVALKSVSQGAATQTWAAVHPGAAGLTGAYLSHCNEAVPTARGRDDALGARLRAFTDEVIAGLP